ncbi:MAG TPA: hypothetical protein VJV96_16605 [Candidatus Angelobacter sp.]|nr:hypothetical protein [Candidatus Angelobacter sp.]
MKQDNRVFSRQNARELTVEETWQVAGSHGVPTFPGCTAPSPANPNGDGPTADCSA